MPASESALSPDAFTRFGELLRFLRLRARLTQRELSIAVGYNFAHLSRLEQGARRPDPKVVAAVFVPALDLMEEPALAARLVELAEQAHQQAVEHTTLRIVPRDEQADVQPPRSAAPAVPEAIPLLATKLFAPRPRPDAVARPRLLAQLDRALSVPLTLVAAPAGFGKSTLLATWLNHLADRRLQIADLDRPNLQSTINNLQSPRVAWLSLDAGDNDLATFVRYLAAACQRLAPTAGQTTLTLLQQPALLPVALLLTPLVNDLAALPDGGLLVLDDVHTLTAPAVHSALAFLLDHLPPHLHLILASREDPPLPLPRLRARGQIVELRARDLRFSGDESAAFLRDTMDVQVSDADAAALQLRTEGWAAGLQLAALALHDHANPSAIAAALSGTQRYLGDYLAGEVLDRLPAHLKTFVLQTSILDQMCGELCDAVLLGRTESERPQGQPITVRDEPGSQFSVLSSAESYSQLILSELERRQLFLIPLDDERRWYRYHHLFADLLRARFGQGASVETVRALHRRAGAWFEAQGLVRETIQHALAGQDWERAAHALEAHATLLMVRGQAQMAMDWLNALPAEILRRHPILYQIQALGLMVTNQVAAAEARLHDAEAALQPDTPDELARVVHSRVRGLRGHMCLIAGDLEQALSLIQQTYDLLPADPTDPTARLLTYMTRAAGGVLGAVTAYKLTGDVSASSERQTRAAIAPVRTLGNLSTTINGYTYLAYLQVLQGRLRTAAATYAEVERLVPDQATLDGLVGSAAYSVGMGDLLREWNDLDAAESFLARGLELAQMMHATDADVIVRGYCALAGVQQARGQGQAALATMEAFREVVREREFFVMLIARAAALRARLSLMQGDLPTAIRWAEGSGLSLDAAPFFPREAADLTLARVQIAAGQADTVMPMLARLLADAESKARRHSAIEILVVQALAYDAQGERQRALAMLRQALALAEPEGYVRSFVDEGAPLAVLLREAERHGIMPAYCANLLAAFQSQPR